MTTDQIDGLVRTTDLSLTSYSNAERALAKDFALKLNEAKRLVNREDAGDDEKAYLVIQIMK
jgi:hypothetical protein